jgi:hypothetical protein
MPTASCPRSAGPAPGAAHPDDAERMESYRRLGEELRSTAGVLDSRFPSD